jgi:hypothetical protein
VGCDPYDIGIDCLKGEYIIAAWDPFLSNSTLEALEAILIIGPFLAD